MKLKNGSKPSGEMWLTGCLKTCRAAGCTEEPPPGSWNLFTADTLTGVSININDAPIHSGVTRTAWQRGNMNHTRSPETEAAKWNSAINLCYFLWRITYWDCGSILKHKHGVKWFLPLPRLLWMDRIITDKWLFLFFFCARLMTEAPPLTDLCLLACLIISAPMFCLPPLSFTRRLKEHYVIYDCYQQLPGASQVQQHPRARVK